MTDPDGADRAFADDLAKLRAGAACWPADELEAIGAAMLQFALDDAAAVEVRRLIESANPQPDLADFPDPDDPRLDGDTP